MSETILGHTKEEYETWDTPKLLAYFKRVRFMRNPLRCDPDGCFCNDDCTRIADEWENQKATELSWMRSILNTREHIPEQPKKIKGKKAKKFFKSRKEYLAHKSSTGTTQ